MRRLCFALLFAAALFAVSIPAQDAGGRVFYRGTIDDRVHLVKTRGRIETRTVSGRAYPDGVYSFTSWLPESPVTVNAAKRKGRGEVKVIQQPSEANNFTAIVEIFDGKGGAKEYQLEIYW